MRVSRGIQAFIVALVLATCTWTTPVYASQEEEQSDIVTEANEEGDSIPNDNIDGLESLSLAINAPSSIGEFVMRLYRNFLGRDADESGLSAWSVALASRKATGAKVVYGFVYSQEFQNNPLDNEAFVTAMYETIFDREPDANGLRSWVDVLENGCTRKKVLAGFLNSDEMRALCDSLGIEAGSYHSDEVVDQYTKVTYFVSRMYRYCLDRLADSNGLNAWVSALVDKRASGSKIATGFLLSKEMENRKLSDRDFVTIAYRALLDREPDSSGLQAWVAALSKGGDRKKIVSGFARSNEFRDLCEGYGIEVKEQADSPYYKYIKEVLIPQYGLASLEPKEGTLYKALDQWLEYEGIVAAYIKDLDNNGSDDLLVFYFKTEKNNSNSLYPLHAAVFESQGGTPVKTDDMELTAYTASPDSNQGVYLSKSQHSDDTLHISVTKHNDKPLILVEYCLDEMAFTSYTYVAAWGLSYENGKLIYSYSSSNDDIASDDTNFTGYVFNNGNLVNKEMLVNWNYGKSPYNNEKDAIKAFWEKYGISVDVSGVRFLPSYEGSIFPDSEVESRIMSFQTKCLERYNALTTKRVRMRLEVSDYTDLRSHLS